MNESVGFKSVLVPLDGSELAEQALPVGASLAGKAGVPLHLVSVQEPFTSLPYAVEFPAAALEIREELRGRLSEYLTRVTSTAQADGAPVVRTAVLDGMVAQRLAEY
ncbi:MAG TPA: universal stress protein, partial [Gemmatimonadales bacterium]